MALPRKDELCPASLPRARIGGIRLAQSAETRRPFRSTLSISGKVLAATPVRAVAMSSASAQPRKRTSDLAAVRRACGTRLARPPLTMFSDIQLSKSTAEITPRAATRTPCSSRSEPAPMRGIDVAIDCATAHRAASHGRAFGMLRHRVNIEVPDSGVRAESRPLRAAVRERRCLEPVTKPAIGTVGGVPSCGILNTGRPQATCAPTTCVAGGPVTPATTGRAVRGQTSPGKLSGCFSRSEVQVGREIGNRHPFG